ncbi:hypothetical protein M1373_01445 [Candidatus Marsarchaeota archaeon]|nr:hypothetical protein [Candidatus Marsarchaeota archaeon]MCL5404962.1 hypothetical protein [Candidatus Marsarchaeota archaeon]
MKKESRCIICGLEKDGLEVKNDRIIDAMRWFKKNVTKNEKGYRLVVCKDCYVKYKKARDSYNTKTISYLVIGVLFAAVLIATGRSIGAVVAGIVVIALMYALSLLSYTPGLKAQPEAKKGTARIKS